MKDKKLAANFWLSEMLESQTAERAGGEMLAQQQNPGPDIIHALHYHAKRTCQRARDFFGVAIFFSSAFRCKLLNTAIGGSSSSQHMDGEATDQSLSRSLFDDQPEIVALMNSIIEGITDRAPRKDVNANFYLFAYYCIFRHEADVDQVIHEYGADGQPKWVHVSSSQHQNRREILVKRSGEGYIRLSLKEALLLGC